MPSEVQPGSIIHSNVNQDVPRLVFGRAAAAARGVNRANMGKGFIELGDRVEGTSGACARGGGRGVGGAPPVDGEASASKGLRDGIDGVNVESEQAIESMTPDMGQRSEGLPVPDRRRRRRRGGGFLRRFGGVRAASGDGAGGGGGGERTTMGLGIEGEGFA